MKYFWDVYERKVYDIYGLLSSGYSTCFLRDNGIVIPITHEHGERHCILIKDGKYRVVKKKKGYDYKKYVRNLTYRGWKIIKYFDEKDLRNIEEV